MLAVRLSDREIGFLEQRALLYTDGNLSDYVRAALFFYMPKMSHFEEEEKK